MTQVPLQPEFTLFPYQEEAVDFLRRKELDHFDRPLRADLDNDDVYCPRDVTGAILAMDTGTGKTIVALKHIMDTYEDHPKCTLVIVPNTISAQWVQNARKMYGGYIRVFELTTMTNYKKLTRAIIDNYHIIVVTFEFLTKRLHELVGITTKNYLPLVNFDRLRDIPQMTPHNNKWQPITVDTATFPTLFWNDEWKRVVIDEYHLLPGYMMWAVAALQAAHFLFMSATPDPSLVDSMIRAFRLREDEEVSGRAPLMMVDDCTFTYRMEDAIEHLPTMDIEVIQVPVTQEERSVLDHLRSTDPSKDYLLVCTNIKEFLENRDSVGSVSEYYQSFIDKLTKKAESLDASLTDITETLEKAQKQLEDEIDELTPDRLDFVLLSNEALEHHVKKLREQIVENQRRIGYFQDKVAELEEEDGDICPICYDQPSSSCSPCGHSFCTACIDRWLDSRSSCPVCRHALERSKLVVVVAPKSGPVLKYSSKIDLMLLELGKVFQNTSDKVLLFCPFPGTLGLLITILQSENIQFLELKGHAAQKKKTIRVFNHNANYRVMLLNPESVNAGVDLMAANHVFFTSVPDYTTMCQALGRVSRLGQSKSIDVKFFTALGYEPIDGLTTSLTKYQKVRECQLTLPAGVVEDNPIQISDANNVDNEVVQPSA